MTTKDEVLKLALEALENAKDVFIALQEIGIRAGRSAKEMRVGEEVIHDRAITAIKQALAAPVQEPDYKALYEKASQQYNELAALMDRPAPVQEPVELRPCWYESKEKTMCRKCGQVHAEAIPPAAQRQWVGLTDEQKLSLEIQGGKSDVMLAELVEGWLKEKNS